MSTPQPVEENLKDGLHDAVVFFTETSYQPDKASVGGRESTGGLNEEKIIPISLSAQNSRRN